MTIESDKNLGLTGSILVLLGVISSFLTIARYALPNSNMFLSGLTVVSGLFGLLSVVGWLLFFVAIYNFSKHYRERKIFDYILYGIIATIVAGVIVGVTFAVFSLGTIIGSSLTSTAMTSSVLDSFAVFMPFFSVIGLIYIVFKVKALNLLSAKSQVYLFNTSAKVFLTGAIVQIILGVIFVLLQFSFSMYNLFSVPAGLVQYVAWALLAKAFYSITPSSIPMAASPTVYPAASAVPNQTKYCIHCGAANSTDMVYCVKCGKKQ